MSGAYFKRYLLRLAMCAAALWLSGCAGTGGQQDAAQGAVVISGDDAELFDAAMAKMAKEQYQEGIVLLKELTGRTQKSAVPFVNIAVAYRKLDDLESAEKNIKAALDIEPDNPVANNEYGLLLRRTGRFDEARAVYENILKKYPKFALANKNLGVLCDIYIRDFSCALEAYRAYSASAPDDSTVKIWISDLEFRVKQ